MPREFRFGSDPEFIFVGLRGNQTYFLPADDDPVLNITNHNCLGEIGKNGCQSTAEMRTHSHPTLDALEDEIIGIINTGARDIRGHNYMHNGNRIAMMAGAMPHGVRCGGHIHVTTTDLEWFHSKEAIQVLPFFVSLVTYMYDKKQYERQGQYGFHADTHLSPDQAHGHRPEDRRRCPNDCPTTTVTISGTRIRLHAWADGFVGWEYRTPTSWITPQNTDFRHKLFTVIKNVIYSEGNIDPPSGEKGKQYEFLKKVCEILGGSIYGEVGARSISEYNRYYERIKSDGEIYADRYDGRITQRGNEHQFLQSFFSNLPRAGVQKHFGKLLEAVLQAQEEIHLAGFDEIFRDIVPADPLRHGDINPSVVYPALGPPMPIRLVSFRSMADAVSAVRESYAAYVASTSKGDWLSFGKSWYDMFPCKYMMANEVARDTLVPEITYIAMALCVDAVQRRGLKVKFLPRSSERSMIYGGDERRSFPDRSADVVVLAHPQFVRDAAIRQLMGSENFTLAEARDEHIYLRMSFRESSSDLRYILVAIYILWRQQYIAGSAAAKNISATVPFRERREGGEVTS
jgi:hypothetical protein